jgi:hypothetical protein
MSILHNTIVVSIVLGLIIATALAVTRTQEDPQKRTGAYVVKVMIIICPIIYLALVFINANTGKAGGGGVSGGSLEMRTGLPDF